eukprot:scaffold1727_cov133-Cylindrotheca_fusiformis.AAC.37
MAAAKIEFETPLLRALLEKRVKAEVIDIDHYRIRGGMAVDTDFIIRVSPTKEPTKGPQFESFTLSKTYSAFRTFAHQLKKSADIVTADNETLSSSVQKLVQYCETVLHLVETQRVSYLGKVNYNYVKGLAKKRSLLIDQVLAATLSYFPDELKSHPFHGEIAELIQTFLLLDHCVDVSDDESTDKTGEDRSPDDRRLKKRHFTFEEPETNVIKNVKSTLDDAVGNAVGNVRAVGDFLKNSFIGDDSVRKPKESGKTPPPIDITIANKGNPLCSPVVPYTRKARRSIAIRALDEDELNEVGTEANLLLDDDRPPTEMVPSYAYPIPNFSSEGSRLGDLLETNPLIFLLIAVTAIIGLKHASGLTVTMDLDILFLLVWAAFCIGLHTPRPLVGGIDISNRPSSISPSMTPRMRRAKDQNGRTLLRMSMVSSPDAGTAPAIASSRINSIRDEVEQDEIMEVNHSPLPKFPDGAKLGSKLNCWSEPVSENFQVRGSRYLVDRRKVPSKEFVFPIRAVDLFLTDTCPQNAGRNPGVLGGDLRSVPTFIVNFRLPWGVLLAYFEIPDRFLPFLKAGHDKDFDPSALPTLDDMSPIDRCVARFLKAPQTQKNQTLKIVPNVVEGPWVVKSVVGGKPAIIGNKMPVNYYYEKATDGKACYLEADLDIVASSAARGILSCVRSYTQILTIDLGFVIQGNHEDELPEQMLVGVRLHGIDPLNAPPYPPSPEMFIHSISEDEDDS